MTTYKSHVIKSNDTYKNDLVYNSHLTALGDYTVSLSIDVDEVTLSKHLES